MLILIKAHSLECILQVSVGVDALSKSLLLVVFAFDLLITTAHELIVFLGSQFARSDVGSVLPECLTAHGTIENLDWLQTETRPYFNKSKLLDIVFLCEFLLMLVHDLVDAEPDAIIVVVKGKNMVNEGL